MKVFVFILGLVFLGSAAIAQTYKSPDLLVYTKLDADWSVILIDKLRTLLVNFKLPDPFHIKVTDKPVVFDEALIGEFVPADSKAFIRDFGQIIGLEILKAKTNVSMHGFEYEVKNFTTDIKAGHREKDGLIVTTDLSASELNLNVDKVKLTLEIPTSNGQMGPVFEVEIIKPMVRVKSERLVNVFTTLKVRDESDQLWIQFLKTDLSNMGRGILAHPDRVELTYEKIVIPRVRVKIGNKEIIFSPEKIEKVLKSRERAIKGLLLSQVVSLMNKGAADAVLKLISEQKLNKQYWVNTPFIKPRVRLEKLSNRDGENTVALEIPGEFCTVKNHETYGENCSKYKVAKIAPTRLNADLNQKSTDYVHRLIDSGEANIVASVSEDYLNNLLASTYDAKLWASTLETAGVEIGPNFITLRLDKEGQSGTLILDVIYKPSRMERIALGRKQVRFPLVLDVGFRLERANNVPVAFIHLNDIDVSDETLLNGLPQYNITSNIRDIPRLRGKVLSTIRSKVASLKGKDIIQLPLPPMLDVGIEKTYFISDGVGRMNAILKRMDFVSPKDELQGHQ